MIALSGGDFVVAGNALGDTTGAGQDSDQGNKNLDVEIRFVDDTMSPLTDAIGVTASDANEENGVSLVELSDGSVLVAWTEVYDTGSGLSTNLRVSKFSATGTQTLDGAIVLAGGAGISQFEPNVVALDGGHFMLTWRVEGDIGAASDPIMGQVFDSDAVAKAALFQVNKTEGNTMVDPRSVGLAGGDVLTVWEVENGAADGDGVGLLGRIWDPDNAPSNAPFVVNTTATGDQYLQSVTALSDGGFVVAWTQEVDTGEDSIITARAQIFSATGTKVGAEIELDSDDEYDELSVAVYGLPDGKFVTAVARGSAGIQLQVYGGESTAEGEAFYVPGSHYFVGAEGAVLDIALLSDGNLALTYGRKFDSGYSSQTYTPTQVFEYNSVSGLNYVGTADGDTQDGGAGNDVMEGGDGNDKMNGLAGHDEISGGAGNDRLSGDAGNDIVDGGAGKDRVKGGTGADDLYGRGGKDDLSGGDGDDYLSGGSGNDMLSGGAGFDQLDTGAGNDTAYGGDGEDTLSGDEGNDQIFGEDGDDEIEGGKGNDKVSGGAGNDYVYGGDGNDKVLGGDGDDELWGDTGNDRIKGGSGNDLIVGGKGKDKLTGNEGIDTFHYEFGHDSRGKKMDTITDFTQGEDLFDFSYVRPNSSAFLVQCTFIGTDAFSGVTGELRTEVTGKSTYIFADLNGDGATDLKVKLKGQIDLVEADFIFGT